MAKVIVFGVRDLASIAHAYLTHDSEHEVVAFTVHRAFLPSETTLHGLPVVAFEEIARHYPPEQHRFLAPLSHRGMNRPRAAVYAEIAARGYAFISYVSSRASVWPGTVFGDNCFVLEDNTIQPFVTIGSNVVLWSGNHVGHHSSIADHVFVSSHCVISGHCRVGAHAFLGVNASLRDGVAVGAGTFVAMATAVNHDTEPWSVYRGNPGRKASVSSTEFEP